MTQNRGGTASRSIVVLMTMTLIVTACSSQDSDTGELFTVGGSGSPTTTWVQDEARTGDAPAPGEEGQALGTGGVAPPLLQTAVDFGRDIIFTADMVVAVTDVAAAGIEATRLIQGLGGFLFGQQTTANPEPRTVLVFKVFPDDFQTALDRLGSIGDLRSQNVFADDVTDRVVDVRSRITTAEASVLRLRGFLENATDIASIADLENQLLQRETQLETLRGQLRTLEDAVSLATITVTITESTIRPAVRVDVSAYSGTEDEGLACPGSTSLTVDQRSGVTVCFEIVNVGDTLLTGFTLRDPVIGVGAEDLIPVFGDLSQTLEPGESIVVAAHVIADRSWRTQTNVTALPVDEDGTVREGRSVANTATISINAVDPGGVPGFGEGLSRSLELLATLGQVAVFVAATLVPFLWIPLGIWWLYRRRSRAVANQEASTPETPQPVGVVED